MAYKILIVDDDPQARLLLTYILKRKGFSLLEAGNGPEALRSVANDSPDLVLLDVMMPGMDGYEVCAALRADPASQALPVVMLTAKTEADAPKRGRAAGASDYIAKPVRPDELVARIQAVLAGEPASGRPPAEP